MDESKMTSFVYIALHNGDGAWTGGASSIHPVDERLPQEAVVTAPLIREAKFIRSFLFFNFFSGKEAIPFYNKLLDSPSVV